MAAATSSKLLNRANGVLGFLVGIFGALAILGVFFKIAKLPNYEIFMAVGFMGEAAAFVLMGIFALVSGFTAKAAASEEGGYGAGPQVLAPTADLRLDLNDIGNEFREELRKTSAAFREELRERLLVRFANDFDAAAEAVSHDVKALGAEMRGLGQEMQHARVSVRTLRGQLDNAGTARLAEEAGALSGQMHQLCEEVSAAGASAQRMRSDLDMLAFRFHSFNSVGNGQDRNGHATQPAWMAGIGDGGGLVDGNDSKEVPR